MTRFVRIGAAVVALTLLVAIGAYAWRGWYARYITDDYCTAVALRKLGFVEAMNFHRQMWSGRYSYYAIKAIPESIGPGTARVMPIVVIALFSASAIWAVHRLLKPRWPVLAVMAGLAVVFASLDGTPEVLAVGGPIMWETGLITYMLPLVLYALWAGLFGGSGSLPARMVASALLMFVAGGLSETSLAAQCALTAAVTVALWGAGGAAGRVPAPHAKIATAGLVASMASLLLVASAPGNAVRASELPPRQPLFTAILESLHLAFSYVGSNIFIGGASLVVVLLAGALLGMTGTRVRIRTALFIAAGSLTAFVASLLPATWTLSMGPPPRALHVSNFFMIGTLMALAAAFGAARPQAMRIAAVLLVVSAIIPLQAARRVIGTMEEGRRGAAEVERIQNILRANRGRDVVIRSPWTLAERVLARNPEFWTNRCICEFYGARSLRVTR